MAILKDGVLVNTPEDNACIEKWLAKQPKIGLINPETDEVYEIVPCLTVKIQ